MTDLRIVSEPRGDAEDATYVRDGLALFNVAVTGDSYYSPLAIFLKDERGAVLGGALGHVWGGSRQRRWSRSRNPGARSSLEAIRSSSLSQDHPEVGEDSSSATTSP
jgi:hypothetical protein